MKELNISNNMVNSIILISYGTIAYFRGCHLRQISMNKFSEITGLVKSQNINRTDV